MTSSLGNLRRKRIRIHRQLDNLEPMLAAYHFKLAHVEAQIQVLAPELPLPARHRTYQPNPYFMRGELPRVALAILREAGEPLPIRVIAARALARKDCHAADRRIFKLTRVRLQQLFGRLEKKGITYSVGTGSATKRGLKKWGAPGRGAKRALKEKHRLCAGEDYVPAQRNRPECAQRAQPSESTYAGRGAATRSEK
jgi:hypothetical protein